MKALKNHHFSLSSFLRDKIGPNLKYQYTDVNECKRNLLVLDALLACNQVFSSSVWPKSANKTHRAADGAVVLSLDMSCFRFEWEWEGVCDEKIGGKRF